MIWVSYKKRHSGRLIYMVCRDERDAPSQIIHHGKVYNLYGVHGAAYKS